MTTPATISAAIDAAAKGPASVTVGKTTVISKDIEQLILADNHQKANAAGATSAAAGFGLRFAAFKPPGAG